MSYLNVMKIFIYAKTNMHENSVEKIDENHFRVSTKEKPIKGKANLAIIKILANYFDIPKNNVVIVSGLRSKIKIIEIIN